MEDAVSERRLAFAAAHRSDENCQAYISASRRATSVIVKAKAKAKAWQTTRSSLSPNLNPKTVLSLLHSIAGSLSRLPPLLIFLTVFLPRDRLWSMPLT